jgi:chitin disaccharide deacetylase
MGRQRLLIVNADDFGQSSGINRGIIWAHQYGIVTSASLMVRAKAAAEAIELSRACPALSLGLHLDLGEWHLRDGEWVALYEAVSLDDRQAVQEEVGRQLGTFRRKVGQNPTHIDSHQHVHLREPVRSIVEVYARELGVPLRRCDTEIRYCGDFYGQDADGSSLPDRIAVAGLIGILTELAPGITELCCHPAAGEDLETMYLAERRRELDVLCDPRIRETIAKLDITLCSFREVFPEKGAGGWLVQS